MLQFWNGEELTPFEMSEYELANMMELIVNKYEHLIDKFASIRYMVDCQFLTTQKWILF